MEYPTTDFPAIALWRTVDQPTTLFARSGFPGLFPDEREARADIADDACSACPYGRRVNDIGQERRRCIEFI